MKKLINLIWIAIALGAGANTLAMESMYGCHLYPSSNPKKDLLWLGLLHDVKNKKFNEAPQVWIKKRVNIPKDDGTTILMIAAQNGDLNAAQLLHLAGADVNMETVAGATALHYAASKGHTEIVKFLISKKAATHARNYGIGYTPLMIAAIEGHLPVVQILLENGAEIDALNQHNFNALSLAAQNGHTEVVHLLIQNGADIHNQDNNALHKAARQDQKSCCQIIVQAMLNRNSAHPSFFCLDQVGAKGDLYFDLKHEVCGRLDAYHTHEVREIVNSINNQRVRKHLLEKFF